MRLIDAEGLKKVIEKNFGDMGGAAVLSQLIDNQPTAFNAERVMEQLKGKAGNCLRNVRYLGDEAKWLADAYKDAIEIVKKGGV